MCALPGPRTAALLAHTSEQGHRGGTALAECAGVIARDWITVGIPYVILFLCISFTKRTHKNSIDQCPPTPPTSTTSPILLLHSAETRQQSAQDGAAAV